MILDSVLHKGHGIESRFDVLVKQDIWMGWKQLLKTKNLPYVFISACDALE